MSNVTIILEINVRGKPGDCTVYVVPGDYQDDTAGDEDRDGNARPYYHEMESAVKLVDSIEGRVGDKLCRQLVLLFEQLGLTSNYITTCDD